MHNNITITYESHKNNICKSYEQHMIDCLKHVKYNYAGMRKYDDFLHQNLYICKKSCTFAPKLKQTRKSYNERTHNSHPSDGLS